MFNHSRSSLYKIDGLSATGFLWFVAAVPRRRIVFAARIDHWRFLFGGGFFGSPLCAIEATESPPTRTSAIKIS